jgi:hypothetical protein
MTNYDKQWVAVITMVMVANNAIAILLWPGWLLFIAANIALVAMAVWCVVGDPRLHEADDA